MKAAALARPQRLTAIVMAAAMDPAGCASPFRFSPRVDTQLPLPDGGPAPAKDQILAGNLHLALAALQDQRRMLWAAADETETMKNATALGLIGLGTAGVYRGLRGTESKGWLERAGLLASATFIGAEWLQPRARQTIYLAGASSLTCLALSTAPYEMPIKEYNDIRTNTATARSALEALATALRLVGRYSYKSDTYYLVRGGWNKLRWASRVLENADNALGNIEAVGPRLRDLTAETASEVAKQIDGVSRDLSRLTAALAQLKPNANALMGSEVFPPPKKDVDVPAPGAPPPPKSADDSEPEKSPEPDASCKAAAPTPSADPAVTELVKQATASAQAASAAANAAQGAASAAIAAVNKTTQSAAAQKLAAAQLTANAASAASAAAAESATRAAKKAREQALEDQRHKAEAEALPALKERLFAATKALDAALGPVTSFVQRVGSARSDLKLPAACGAGTVTLLPAKRDIQLQPGESFQFLLAGDTGKASAQFIELAPGADVLDLSMPLTSTATAVRLTAGRRVLNAVNTVVRITDSKSQQSFDVMVKVCAGSS